MKMEAKIENREKNINKNKKDTLSQETELKCQTHKMEKLKSKSQDIENQSYMLLGKIKGLSEKEVIV